MDRLIAHLLQVAGPGTVCRLFLPFSQCFSHDRAACVDSGTMSGRFRVSLAIRIPERLGGSSSAGGSLRPGSRC